MRYYIGAISLTANGKKLMWSKYEGDTMPVLYGLKFFTIIWIFLGHRMKLCVQQPMVGLSLLKVGTYLKNWGSMIFFNGTLAANVFFLISGTLNTYTYLNSSSQKSKRFLSHVWRYIKRYLRLTPAYAMVILGAATWMYRVGDGPLWDQIVGSAQNDCVNYWWTDLLYINNYYNPLNICIMQSWYLAAEMQMFWVSTIVLYTLWRWPKLGVVKLIFLTAVSIVVPFYVVYKNKIKTPMPFSLNQTVLDMQTTELYVPTHTKMVSYVTGLLCGYIIYLLRKRRITLKLSLGQNLLVWLVAFTLTSWAVFGGHHLFVLYSPYNRLDSSFNIALSPFCWSVGISWMIIACTMGYGGPINHILSWKGWIPLGRLSYGIYLTHVLCILYTLGTLRTTQYFTFYNVVLSFGGELIMSTFFALVLNLTIESPVIALMKGSNDTIERRQRRNSPPEISVQNISNAVGNRRSRC